MEIIFATSTLIIFLFGFVIIKKINYALADYHVNSEMEELVDSGGKSVLILGTTIIAEKLMGFLSEKKIDYEHIEDSNLFNSHNHYKYLFAVSDDDFENLMIGIITNVNADLSKKIAICNKHDNIKIFEQNNIPCIIGSDISEVKLYNAVFNDR